MRTAKSILPLICVLMLGLSSCKYDDSGVKEDIKKLDERVSSLERWQTTVNTNIKALQGLVAALQDKNFVTKITSVVENGKEVGYKLEFEKGNPILIKHGIDGKTPVIGVAKDTDGKYYWTVKVGSAEPTFLKNEKGEKIPAVGERGEKGDDAVAPQVRINPQTNEWEISIDGGQTWTRMGDGVKATGPKGDKGDSMFSKVDTTNPREVVFTLADGTVIALPRVSNVSVAFESYDLFQLTPTNKEVRLVLPENFKETDYVAIVAELKSEKGTDVVVSTRAEGEPVLTVVNPTFTETGVCNNDAKVVINASKDCKAILKVTLIDSYGKESSVSRPIDMRMKVKSSQDIHNQLRQSGSVLLDADFTLSALAISDGQDLTIDLNNHKLTINGTSTSIINHANSKLVFKNGTIDFARPKFTTDMAVRAGFLSFENVEMKITNGAGLRAQGESAKMVIRDSKVNATYYAISSNATVKDGKLTYGQDASIILERSEFIGGETPLMNNVPAKIVVTNCKFVGNHQGALFRGGTYIIRNSSFVLNAELPVDHQENKHKTDWASGNNATFAAITIGNRSAAAYRYSTSVVLEGVTAKVEGKNAGSSPAVYVHANSEPNMGVTFNYDSRCIFETPYERKIEYGSTNIVVNGKAAEKNQP